MSREQQLETFKQILREQGEKGLKIAKESSDDQEAVAQRVKLN